MLIPVSVSKVKVMMIGKPISAHYLVSFTFLGKHLSVLFLGKSVFACIIVCP
jgi:hypothetical protein